MNSLFKNRTRELYLAGVVVLIALLVGVKSSDFLGITNLVEVFNDTSILLMLALGQMIVIITRGIDLSIAANLALTGMIVALINSSMPDLPLSFLILFSIVFGAILGSFNGLLVWKLGLPAIVVTLGTMAIYRGVIFLLSNGEWVNSHEMTHWFVGMPRETFLGVPLLSYFGVIALVLMFLFLSYFRIGREIYASGSNPHAASYTGINIGRTQFFTFVISGAISGFCGYLWVARYAVAYVDIANGFELQVVAACVIGGISIAGGSGTLLGCLLGCLFLGVVNNALPVIGISPFWKLAISGGVIIAAVVLNSRSERSKQKIILKPESAEVQATH